MIKIVVEKDGIQYQSPIVADGKAKCGKCLRGNVYFLAKKSGIIIMPAKCRVCGAHRIRMEITEDPYFKLFSLDRPVCREEKEMTANGRRKPADGADR